MENNIIPRLLITITNSGNEKKLKEVFDKMLVPVALSCPAQGTAPSSIMDILGLSGRTKVITAALTRKAKVNNIFKELNTTLSFADKGKGIAFTMPLTGLQSHVIAHLGEEKEGDEIRLSENKYSVIFASCTSGYSDDVFEAARKAGATGGTIIKGIREVTETVSEKLGVPLKDEQDFILILVLKENKKEIMTAIMEKCGMNTDAHTMVVSLPVDEVFGLS